MAVRPETLEEEFTRYIEKSYDNLPVNGAQYRELKECFYSGCAVGLFRLSAGLSDMAELRAHVASNAKP